MTLHSQIPDLIYTIVDQVGKRIYKKIAWLNELPADEAERVFRECSSSQHWARQMAAFRPYLMIEPLFASGEHFWAQRNRNIDFWPHIEERLVRLLER